jgi:diaminohydroxyphosphoribosylaminopyrimidine deaminase/5-amino-6-(5-phosphoribosylamino)uracil reductase
MRALHDAILIGIGTALADNPQLTCRLPGMEQRSPVRVVMDDALRLPLDAALVHSARSTPLWVICGTGAPVEREQALRRAGAEVLRVEDRDGHLDLAATLRLLAGRGITRLLVEGGPTIAAAFVSADLVDEAILVRSANRLDGGINALEGVPLAALTQSPRLAAHAIEQVGGDTFESYERP